MKERPLPRVNADLAKDLTDIYGQMQVAQAAWEQAYRLACHAHGVDPTNPSIAINLPAGQFIRRPTPGDIP